MKPKVKFENVSKSYTLYEGKFDKLLDIFKTTKKNKTFYALKNVSFEVYEGETIGIIGVNGSGKSTLSNLLAQVLPPTSGKISINGETSLIAISAGLNNNLTGMENIEIKCLMHGLKKEEIKEITPKIIEFADIGDFINQPVKNYSSGMRSRLGFAISVHTDPDVLIIDEALSVGDETFYEKCLAKMEEFKQQGKTIFFISHSISQVRSFCDKVIWLHHGQVQDFGRIGKVIKDYKEYIAWHKGLSAKEQRRYKNEMMAKQLKNEENDIFPGSDQELSRSRSFRKVKVSEVKEKKNFLLGALFIFFIINAFLLINNGVSNNEKTADAVGSKEKVTSTEKSSPADSLNQNIKTINSEGFVLNNDSEVYAKAEKKNLMNNLDFSEKVYVLEKSNDVYKIQLEDGAIGYTQEGNIKLVDSRVNGSDMTMNDLLFITPNSFKSAYEFYLSYLNSKEEVIKNNLNGLSNVVEVDPNHTILEYSGGEIQFHIENGVATAVVIKNIDIESPEFFTVAGNASLIDNEENYFLLNTENNKVIVNKNEKSLKIEER
ncbi:teichoic acids export ABC transporter ATP-binding subunit TagH [Neobacillus sp. 179-C4.2 HS]|uniref:Teichoic acids export ABC transporter ATP-binding subunit TagH n=1 Tax=Neobacillus driksii TaxID=3035913 RepID=A0ABV4Z1S1_9BACI|nr:teichoic acids export ABC transporter ATP-binding subunit TagH [Neobacillus sp. 179.-C4.2 HS]MDP5194605.1 teichoic acids export ABC transporter ATP-binding subunit TagH [Neobacillus sp. 179.-C4.2 HS]